MSATNRKPVAEDEIVVHVAKGYAAKVRVAEVDANDNPNEITVQISQKRKAGVKPVLGVIVK